MPLVVKQYARHAKVNARIISTPDGDLLNVWAIWTRYRVNPWTFYRKQRDGWRSLNGGKLTVYPLPKDGTGHGTGRTENYFREADVAIVFARQQYPIPAGAGTWMDARTYREEGGDTWYTAKGAHRTYGIPTVLLARWAKRSCRFLDGQPLASKRVTSPPGVSIPEVSVYLDRDLRAIDQQRRRLRPPGDPYRDSEGVWLTEAQVEAAYSVTRNFVKHWMRKKSRLRPGQQALRAKPIPNAVQRKGAPPMVRGCLDEDVKAIFAGRESKFEGVGRSPRQAGKAERQRKAASVLKTILAGGPIRADQVIAQAREQGVCRRQLYEAKAALKVKAVGNPGLAGAWQWSLPGQKPPVGGADAQGPSHQEGTSPALTPAEPENKTWQIYSFCYEWYVTRDMSKRVVMNKVNRHFGQWTIKEESMVRLYAYRYANKYGLPKKLAKTQ